MKLIDYSMSRRHILLKKNNKFIKIIQAGQIRFCCIGKGIIRDYFIGSYGGKRILSSSKYVRPFPIKAFDYKVVTKWGSHNRTFLITYVFIEFIEDF